MTVCDEFEPLPPANRWLVECCWHNDVGDPQSETYPVAALYEPDEVVESRAMAFKLVP